MHSLNKHCYCRAAEGRTFQEFNRNSELVTACNKKCNYDKDKQRLSKL